VRPGRRARCSGPVGGIASGACETAWMTQPAAAEIRRWAQAVGVPVGQRGRLSPEVRDAFQAAQSAQTSPRAEAGGARATGQHAAGDAGPLRTVRVAPAVGVSSVRRIRARQG
jgi:hypothetical protein